MRIVIFRLLPKPIHWLLPVLAVLALWSTALGGSAIFLSAPALANDAPPAQQDAEDSQDRKGRVTGLPLPRFVSLKASRVNVRRGPGKSYPVEWVYEKRGLPVEITAEHDRWRRVRDHDGDIGWIWHAMLDGRRSAILLEPGSGKEKTDAPSTEPIGQALLAIHANADADSAIVAYAEPGIIAELQACNGSWCRVKVENYRGWMQRAALWGVYAHENFE